MYSYFEPYVNDEDDTLQEIAQYQVFFTLLIALIIRDGTLPGQRWSEILDVVLTIISISTLFVTLMMFVSILKFRKYMILQKNASSRPGMLLNNSPPPLINPTQLGTIKPEEEDEITRPHDDLGRRGIEEVEEEIKRNEMTYQQNCNDNLVSQQMEVGGGRRGY